MCGELSLDGGRRHQAIFLSELHDDDGRNYLRVNTVIAPITGIDARRALAFNWQSRIGYLAIDELDGVPYLHLCENRPYDALTAAEVDRLLLEIGGVGYSLERALSAEGELLSVGATPRPPHRTSDERRVGKEGVSTCKPL